MNQNRRLRHALEGLLEGIPRYPWDAPPAEDGSWLATVLTTSSIAVLDSSVDAAAIRASLSGLLGPDRSPGLEAVAIPIDDLDLLGDAEPQALAG